MRKAPLVAAAMAAWLTLTTFGAPAALPGAPLGVQAAPARGMANVDYGWNHHRWHDWN